jgi:hypothetical protein
VLEILSYLRTLLISYLPSRMLTCLETNIMGRGADLYFGGEKNLSPSPKYNAIARIVHRTCDKL